MSFTVHERLLAMESRIKQLEEVYGLPQPDPENCYSFQRIYEDDKGFLRVSHNVFDRKTENPKNCITIGWVVYNKDNPVVKWVEGA